MKTLPGAPALQVGDGAAWIRKPPAKSPSGGGGCFQRHLQSPGLQQLRSPSRAKACREEATRQGFGMGTRES